MPLSVALADLAPVLRYQMIAERALHLRELGLKDAAIARRLGVTGKT